jgi:hypothetical protein
MQQATPLAIGAVNDAFVQHRVKLCLGRYQTARVQAAEHSGGQLPNRGDEMLHPVRGMSERDRRARTMFFKVCLLRLVRFNFMYTTGDSLSCHSMIAFSSLEG